MTRHVGTIGYVSTMLVLLWGVGGCVRTPDRAVNSTINTLKTWGAAILDAEEAGILESFLSCVTLSDARELLLDKRLATEFRAGELARDFWGNELLWRVSRDGAIRVITIHSRGRNQIDNMMQVDDIVLVARCRGARVVSLEITSSPSSGAAPRRLKLR